MTDAFLKIAAWETVPDLFHGFGTAAAGGGNNPPDGDEALSEWKRATVERAAKAALARAGASFDALLTVRQIHSPHLLVVRRTDPLVPPSGQIRCDGILCDRPGLLVGVKTADCQSILLHDPVNRAAAAVHAGWKGTYRKILKQAIRRMEKEFGTLPENLRVAFGPAARACCYEVSPELAEEFRRRFGRDVTEGPEDRHLNLVHANRVQAVKAGVPESRIEELGGCTICSGKADRYSHRRDAGRTGRMLSVIGIAGPKE